MKLGEMFYTEIIFVVLSQNDERNSFTETSPFPFSTNTTFLVVTSGYLG